MAMAMTNSSDELWRECIDWLTRCKMLRSDHKTNSVSATIVDLASMLRDGVLLCNLLNVLDPGCIDMKDVNLQPQMAQFLCLRNIRVFLRTCKEVFGIGDADLFKPEMLFDLTNFHRVLCTLSKLSNSQRALRQNVTGFSAHRNGSQEDIYQSLQCIDTPIGHNRMLLDDHEDYGTYYSHIINEEIYQDLCTVQQSTTAPPIEKKDHVIKELIDTENNYVEVLNKLKTCFMKPLAAYLSSDQLNTIFKEIPELYNIHSEFLHQLKLFSSEGKPKLSTTFLNWREKFLIYGSYCANITSAQSLIQDLCDHDPAFNQEVTKCQTKANNGKFKLSDVLSVPMQRILKYHLLLQKLIEETPRNHEEYMSLQRAKESMDDVAMYINEVKRDSDHLMLLRKMQDSIMDFSLLCDYSLHIYGHLLLDGELKIYSHADHKVHMRYVFIFDKIMIICKSKFNGKQYMYKESLSLQEYQIEDVTTRPILNSNGRWGYQWVLRKRNREVNYTLSVGSADLKKKMIMALQEAIDNNDPISARNTNHKLEMFTFEKAATCNRCSKFLKGLFYQGYRCKVCGIAVHKGCISQSGKCELPPAYPPPVHHMDKLVHDKLWFVGTMERSKATAVLQHRKPGTYLLRVRPDGDPRYALGLKTSNIVRHMKIFTKHIEDIERFYLSQSRFFRTVLELVRFYQHESLNENYDKLDKNTMLEWPYKQIIAVAEYDYVSDDINHLPLRKGCRLIILSKDDREDWWRGKMLNKVGVFPKTLVKVLEETTQDIE